MRKSTQPTMTSRNVTATASGRGSDKPRWRPWCVPASSTPWYSPHATKFSEAPCHRPPSAIVANRFDVAPPLALPVAAERDVEVVAQPGRERDVPAPPELRRARGAVRTVEVPGQLDAEDAREAERHVGVRAEVEVDLEAEADRAGPRVDEAELRRRREVMVDVARDPVGEQHLLREPEREEQRARSARGRRRSDASRAAAAAGSRSGRSARRSGAGRTR